MRRIPLIPIMGPVVICLAVVLTLGARYIGSNKERTGSSIEVVQARQRKNQGYVVLPQLMVKHPLWKDVVVLDSKMEANREHFRRSVDSSADEMDYASISNEIDELSRSLKKSKVSESILPDKVSNNLSEEALLDAHKDVADMSRELMVKAQEKIATEAKKQEDAYGRYKAELEEIYQPEILKYRLKRCAVDSLSDDDIKSKELEAIDRNIEDLNEQKANQLKSKAKELDDASNAYRDALMKEAESELGKYSRNRYALVEVTLAEPKRVKKTTSKAKRPAVVSAVLDDITVPVKNEGILDVEKEHFRTREEDLVRSREQLVTAIEREVRRLTLRYGVKKGYTIDIVNTAVKYNTGKVNLTNQIIKSFK